VLSDVSAVRKQVQEAEHEASHDPLTGLVNRREFGRRVDRIVGLARRGDGEHALAFIDLDRFKLVNDTLGHRAGDEVLQEVADVFRGCIRGADTLGRLGGDEFGLLLPDCSLDRARLIAQRLVATLEGHRFEAVDGVLSIGTSVGVVGFGPEAPNTLELIARADAACYAAKERGRGCVEVSLAGADPENP
jgi:diguanylate cyclase (GGDEF)-like protein